MIKKASLLLLSISAVSLFSHAQDGMSELAAIRFAYEKTTDRKIKGINADIGYDQWEVRAPFYFSQIRDWTLAAGIRYQSTQLDISDTSVYPLLEDQLHSLDLALYVSKQSSDSVNWLFLFNPSLSGDYENMGSDAFNYLAIAGAKWEQSDHLQWIFGAVYTSGIGDDMFLPAVGFIWEPSDNSTLVFAGPIIRYNYQFSSKWELNLGGQFVGNRWHTEANYGGSIEKRDVRFRSYRISVNLQYNIGRNHALFAGGGIDFAGELELETPTARDERDVESGGNFEIGYKYKF
ncbi:MAG: DUF6268 family outer membrane beta-barrel protein [Opitutales bacterium]|nr:DUF6268 family outer membrane beta-barrel protein [Opitutales bacterium]